jgi:ankyrin repeat protein
MVLHVFSGSSRPACHVCQEDGATSSLYIASQNGHTEVVKVLLHAGADVHQAEKDGWTSLIFASQKVVVKTQLI